ncbi:carbonic anhydrase [Streptomyces sp. DSM 3412]|uniref:Carbonic anhydrase n=1 Tax=Streptomyces gottesmaniae TaxID=3075518 RepID=A0ABU2YPG1_9ACTN|nr:carbonic anhydrase [Streptomyces sp. DSM 3412]MDT0566216.1 carbonic anhydrase [Streptomyces sp. DSM 3412]
MGNAVRPQRRAILTGGLAAASAAVLTACSSKTGGADTAKAANLGVASPAPNAGPRPDTARATYDRLLDGNKRWVSGKPQHPDQDPARRAAVASEQKPYGVIVSCIDSRVPPELVFDTGIGDLFVIRTGGQVVQPVVVGSVEYGPLTAGSPLIVVLGHQNCGAIKAAYKALKDDEDLPGNLQSIVEALRPAYEDIAKTKHADPVDAMIRAHANRTAADLRSNTALAPLVKRGDLSVVSAYYSLDTGRVETLTGAPSS